MRFYQICSTKTTIENVKTVSRFNCSRFKIIFFMKTRSVGTIHAVSANYMLMMLSIDRVIAVWFPIFYYQNSKPSYALMTSVVIVFISSVVTLPSANLYGIQNGVCSIVNFDWLTPEQADLFLLVAGFGLLLFIPLMGIFVANILIIWKLRGRASRNFPASNVVPSQNLILYKELVF